MVSRGGDRFVLWPRYFNRKLSRAQGRRVPLNLAVKDPDAAWIESAAKRSGLDPNLEEDARDPMVPWRKSGRVLVAKKGSKEQVIKRVAQRMAESGKN